MNGREWLCRQLEKENIGFERYRNKFLHIDDYGRAQQLLDAQLETDWCLALNAFLPQAFPTMSDAVGSDLSYTWNCWQSEWASDMIFNDTQALSSLMDSWLKYTVISGHADCVDRFFGRPTNQQGQPHHAFRGNIQTNVLNTSEGVRVKHQVDSNSVKIYNEQNVVRIETTINKPNVFKVNRKKQGAQESAPKERLPVRKDIADVKVRAKVSQEVNDRFSEHLDATHDSIPMIKTLSPILNQREESKSPRSHGKRQRGSCDDS